MKTCLLIDAFYLREFISLGLLSRWFRTGMICHTSGLVVAKVEERSSSLAEFIGPDRLAVYYTDSIEISAIAASARQRGCGMHEVSIELLAAKIPASHPLIRRQGSTSFHWPIEILLKSGLITEHDAISLNQRWGDRGNATIYPFEKNTNSAISAS
ncbi:MAG: hypothetical protein JSS11_05815 [Verrucomicrobia bacterium]|nr:hypothetical protein [Verrucomicrobiota bacterium]